jgi:long-chain acyl-CoA synthetase
MLKMRDEVHYGNRVVRCFAERPPHLAAIFRAAVEGAPDATALVEGERRVTYRELGDTVERIAGNLAALGVGKGDRVALILGNRIEFMEATYAVIRLGAVVVPINLRQRKPENEYVLAQSGAMVLIHEADLRAEMPEPGTLPGLRHRFAVGGTASDARPYGDLLVPGPVAPAVAIAEEDLFSILYTSGTTGRPKGAMLTHLSTVHSMLHIVNAFEFGATAAQEVGVLAVPASHVTGLVAIMMPLLRVRGRLIIMTAFKARAFLELVERERVSFGVIVPAMYNLCLLDPELGRFDLSSWRIGAYGGAPMPEATITRMAAACPSVTLLNSYGATETTSPTTLMPLGQGTIRIDTVGRVLPCAEVRVMDDDGREVEAGQSGEIWIAGPMVVPGYWDNPEGNAANFVAGYWKSGDIGSKDADGFVKVFDRKKDMINRGGYKIYSAEVENVLSHHPAVLECAIVASSDPVLGERSHAYIVPRETAPDAEDIRRFCAERLSDYKVPDFITFLSEPLPRNPNGKVLKPALRQRTAT